MATAQRVAEAVRDYHDAADKIDEGDRLKAAGSVERLAAIQKMKGADLTIAAIAELTGLSGSRVQTLLRPDAAGPTEP